MRVRVLTLTAKGKLLTMASMVKKLIEADKEVDKIPPAYPCDGERLAVLVVSAKSKMPETFNRFVRTLNKRITANIAFIIDGTPENAAKIIELAKSGNSNVIEDNVLYVDGGLPFKFLKKVTPEEQEKVEAWVKEIRASLK